MAMQETWSYSSWFGKCSIQYAYTVFWPYHILRFVSTIFDNVLINISRLTFSNQFLQKFEVCCMNILLSVLQHLRVNYFANSVTAYWKVTKGLWWKHITAVQSINEVRFMKLQAARKNFKTCCTAYLRS